MVDCNYSKLNSRLRRFKAQVAETETSTDAEIIAEAELLVLSFMFCFIFWVDWSELQAHSGLYIRYTNLYVKASCLMWKQDDDS